MSSIKNWFLKSDEELFHVSNKWPSSGQGSAQKNNYFYISHTSVPSCFFWATPSLRYKASTAEKYLKVEYRTGVLMTGGHLDLSSDEEYFPTLPLFSPAARCLLLKQSSSICNINNQIRGNVG